MSVLGRGIAWLDTGTHETLMKANQFVHAIESSQGYKIACLEEIAYNKEWLSKKDILLRAGSLNSSEYGNYLEQLVSK